MIPIGLTTSFLFLPFSTKTPYFIDFFVILAPDLVNTNSIGLGICLSNV